MLFDLRGRGRRRTIQAIYLSLAILMGGGLVFFGVGGSGVGLLNTDNDGGGGGSVDDALERQLDRAEQRVRARPRDPAAWATLASRRFQNAGVGENFAEDPATGAGDYTAAGRAELRRAGRAWKRFLALDPERIPIGLARQMGIAFTTLGDAPSAVRALEIVSEQAPTTAAFQQLAITAYAAGQTRKGNLAAAEAIRRSPADSRQQVRAQIDAAKRQASRQSTAGQPAPPGGG